MTQVTHQPGTWHYEKNEAKMHAFNVYGDGLRICEVFSGEAVFTKPLYGCPEFIGTRGEANARLIAAAPELLEALEMCEKWFRQYSEHVELLSGNYATHPMLLSIIQTIKKAKGE